MWLHINPRSVEPIYAQIVQGVKTATAKGVLAPGTKLPSVRELATELAVNHNTVAKAYQELERDKVIEVIRGRGTFTCLGQGHAARREERLQEIRASVHKWLVEAHHVGLTSDDFLSVVKEVVEEWASSKGVGEVE